VARSAVSALRGWSGEPQKSVEIRWIGIGVVRGWSSPRTGQVCESISAQTPWIHPESKIRSEIAIDTRSMGSLLRRFDRQSNGQHAIVLEAGPGDVWGRYLAVKLPQRPPIITNSIVYNYCTDLARAEGNRTDMSETLGLWMSRFGETALSSEASTSAGVLEALEDSQCDVSLLNDEIRDGVRICGLSVDHGVACPGVRMTEYQPRVVRSRKCVAQAWGVSSELRPEWSERGFIVQRPACNGSPPAGEGPECGGCMQIHTSVEGLPSEG
jgi:hypothetical protein